MRWSRLDRWSKHPDEVLREASSLIGGGGTRDEKLLSICRLLKDCVPYYDWVGFYLVLPQSQNELQLGPYIGAPTEHVKIPFGKGICGQAAQTKELFLVQDVMEETNYLSCGEDVRSEIVVPIIHNGVLVGELDIDSHRSAPFGPVDEKVLARICEAVAGII